MDIIFFVINLVISYFNAYYVGKNWIDAKYIGGWQYILLWCAGIMSACGFTSCYSFIIFPILHSFNIISDATYILSFKIEYLMIIFPILGSGIMIWLNSIIVAFKERTFGSIGTAAWNSYAMFHNSSSAITTIPNFINDILDDSSDSEGGNSIGIFAFLLCLIVASLGIFTTIFIIRREIKNSVAY